ncbi:hypothetical protein T310_2631 [Rasamsonia emersonii CBS 393.64]|uniref:Uncharacterized protein n=1 Tax=Rasamsonia emersonii (strain ATCC 16479 / CBS 393.64 / IMI 116815) TaxID=1408163 RepID=A0A0F4YYK2_RASE3|nr:hypothetical protein T310_2631 [Rasamsonia emersonii CBS 393.64]KKA23377.1 hypothetical protein T310_2631 [Rasamsonia emersonii CBS 393.64]
MSPHKDKNANTNTKFNAVSSTLFKIAALINAISIPFHEKYGHDHIHSALATIAETPDLLIGKYGAWYTWHYIDAMFAVVGKPPSHKHTHLSGSDFFFWAYVQHA